MPTQASSEAAVRGDLGSRPWRSQSQLLRYWPVLHYAIGHVPWLFFPLFRWREPHRAHLAVGPRTDIVVEGFPRSSNTFAVIALKYPQPGPIATADHVHVPAQVIRGAQLGKPILVLARRPEDVVRSAAVKFPHLRVSHLLRGYARFYEHCWPWREHFVVATFDQVTGNFGAVVRRLNRRFRLDLRPFEHTPESMRAVFDRIDARNRATPVTLSSIQRPRDALTAALPSRAKDAAKAMVVIDADPALLERCRRVYARYAALAGATP